MGRSRCGVRAEGSAGCDGSEVLLRGSAVGVRQECSAGGGGVQVCGLHIFG